LKQWCLRSLRALGTLSALAFVPDSANALEAFGFTGSMSPKQVEQGVQTLGLGVSKWFGRTLIVQAQDHHAHSYMFNFCNEHLYEVTQSFPSNFDRMAGVVEETIKQFGQPILVSAAGGMGTNGFVRPTNFYWKVDEKDYLRLMQMENSFSLVYATENACTKVPR
jgi:hypothetical protein